MSNITIKITEKKNKTVFSYCGNGKKAIKKAAKLQEAGESIESLTMQQKAFLAAIHTLYMQDFICTSEE